MISAGSSRLLVEQYLAWLLPTGHGNFSHSMSSVVLWAEGFVILAGFVHLFYKAGRIGGTFRAYRLPSVWIPLSLVGTGIALAAVGWLWDPTRADPVVIPGLALGMAGMITASIRLSHISMEFQRLEQKFAGPGGLRAWSEPFRYPALVAKELARYRELVLKLRRPDSDTALLLDRVDHELERLTAAARTSLQ